MRLPVLLFVLLFCSTTYAQDINKRVEVSKKIMKVYQEICSTIPEKFSEGSEIKEAFELAAIYLIHGEYNHMKEQILKARSISKSRACQKATDDFLI